MALVDLADDELRCYRGLSDEPADLDAFWAQRLRSDGDHSPRVEKVDNRLRLVDSYDVVFPGAEGAEQRAWLHLPAGAAAPLPCIVRFGAYSEGRGLPLGDVFADAGLAVLHLDSRAQGWATPTVHPSSEDSPGRAARSTVPGVMTRGIGEREDSYLVRLYADAVFAVAVAAGLDCVDGSRVVVHGWSQGGALAIAAAALGRLVGVDVAGAMIDSPFLCDIPRATKTAQEGPYLEIVEHLRVRPGQTGPVFATLAHVDGSHLAKRATCPALFSTGLLDPVCPPEGALAAFNAWGGADKDIVVYDHGGHDGGGPLQLWHQLEWLARLMHG